MERKAPFLEAFGFPGMQPDKQDNFTVVQTQTQTTVRTVRSSRVLEAVSIAFVYALAHAVALRRSRRRP